MSQWPTPGQEKIVSVSTAPAIRPETERPITVTTGRSALRKACMPMTRDGLSPLARAVRT